MGLKQLAVLILGISVLAYGLYQVIFLSQYNTQAQGTITSFFTVDSNSIILGLTFSEKRAQANVYFQAKNKKAYNFTVYDSKPGGSDTKLSIAPNIHVPLIYNLAQPQNALSLADFQKKQLSAILSLGFGGIIIALTISLPWWLRRDKRMKGPIRPPHH